VAGIILEQLGNHFDHARRRYTKDPGDLVWMSEIGAEGDWIVVSGDEAISRNPTERMAWINMNCTTFFLSSAWMNVRLEEQAWRLLRWLPRMIEIARSEDRGTGLSLPLRWHGGNLNRIFSPRASG
jgi:hypothetical protein